MPTILRLEALTLPKKTYELNAEALEDLATIQATTRTTETAAVTIALRNLAEMMRRNLPIYMSSEPQEPEPPTTAPQAARARPQRVVEIRKGKRK